MRAIHRFSIYAMLVLGSITFLIPLLWMISTGLKPIDQTMSMPPRWLPYRLYVEKDGALTEIKQSEVNNYPANKIIKKVSPRWNNFAAAIHAMKHFPRYLENTLILCVLTVAGTVLSSALAAYGFARIDWPGRNKLFVLALATMMVPFPVTMVPIYCLYRWLGWIGTLKPLWVGSFFAGAFNVFLLRQFFMTIPKDLSEAARIDGCGEFRIFWQIILPLCKPALMVVALFQFMSTWNDFMGPLIYLTDEKDYTLALGLQAFQSQHGGTEWHYLMAASTLVALPIIVLFFFTQKSFIEGISMTGIKG
jgi:multiple sugar transport system permease protein